MTIERALIRRIRELDEFDLRRLLIFVRGLLIQRGDGPQEPETREAARKVSYRLQSIRCGKDGCTKCPHGPYWYAYWREGGRMRSRYLGRRAPAGAGPDVPPPPRPAAT